MGTNTDLYTLWGTPHSLYTGKARSYLIKKRLPFRELCPSHPRYRTDIKHAVRLKVSPILETPEGQFVQDTTDIIEFLEARHPEPSLTPEGPVQDAIAWLVGAFGSEGLLQPAMSYRWVYREQQERYLRAEFGRVMHAGPDREERLSAGLKMMDYMGGYLKYFGINDETLPTIETAYGELLDALDIHFQHFPYVLGGRPSVADFGLMAPLYAHLSRDPVPSSLMKNQAPNVYRWTERMNLANVSDGEFWACPETWMRDDGVPETLEPVLKLIFQDWGPELIANAESYNAWIAANPRLATGHPVSSSEDRVVHPTLGMIEYDLRGRTMRRTSAPHSLWHFDKVLARVRSLEEDAAQRFRALVARNGGERVMDINLARPLERRDYILVVGAA